MTKETMLITALCLSVSAASGADDEVRFKPQAYKPGKELSAKPYAEKPYTASEKAAARPVGEAMPAAQVKRAEVKPLAVKELSQDAKPFGAPTPAQADPFKPDEKQTYVPTISPPNMAAMKKKPYMASTNKLGHTVFTLKEEPKEKNPMLQPRQGIKELPPDDGK